MRVKKIQQFKILALSLLGVVLMAKMTASHAQLDPSAVSKDLIYHSTYLSNKLDYSSSLDAFNDDLRAGSPQEAYFLKANYRERLRRIFSVKVNPHLQMGLDRIKAGPISEQKKEIIALSPQLQAGISSSKGARGYGIEVTLKFD